LHPQSTCYLICARRHIANMFHFLLTSRRPPRRLESLRHRDFRADLRILAHHYHLRHLRQRLPCPARNARPPIWRQHERLHLCWSSLYVVLSLISPKEGKRFRCRGGRRVGKNNRDDLGRWLTFSCLLL